MVRTDRDTTVEKTSISAVYSLNKIKSVLGDYRLPTGSFYPDGAWSCSYDIHYLNKSGGGSCTLVRRPGQPVTLAVSGSRRGASGYNYYIDASLQLETDFLSTPIRWDYSSKLATSSKGNAKLFSGIHKSAVIEDGHLLVATSEQFQRSDLLPQWAEKWAMFDAVQRMPRADFAPATVSFIDELDQVKGPQTISYYKTIQVEINDQDVVLHGYQRVGHGILPCVYWVDEQGRCLFVITGTENYILDKAKMEG